MLYVDALLAVVVLVIVALAAMIAFSRPGHPPPLRSVVDAITGIRADLGDLPEASSYRARDGTALRYRSYLGDRRRVAVLVHGSSVSGAMMHPLACALQRAGATAYTLDLRGHAGTGVRGDLAYVGQLDDDLVDFVASLGAPVPGERRVLLGFSAGGGYALRFAGGAASDHFDGYLLLAPFLGPDAPTVRPEAGWASVALPRIIALSLLDAIGLRAFGGLPVVGFALPAKDRADPAFTPAYSFRMLMSFGPHRDWRADLRGIRRPVRVLIGADDEIFAADRMGPVLHELRPDIPVDRVAGADHVGLVLRPAALSATVAAFDALAHA
jgi:non-heme chloroperoxidase